MATQPKRNISIATGRSLFQRVRLSGSKVKLGLTASALTVALVALGLTATAVKPPAMQASDHDDGDIDTRSRALSLTDLYAFREIDQNPSADANDLIFVINTNPRSLARQQYFFSTQAQYDLKLSRVGNNDSIPTATPNVTLRFTFSQPTSSFQQRLSLTLIEGNKSRTVAQTTTGGAIVTTPITAAGTPILNQVRLGGATIGVFAGLREDPFFFDVDQFFRVRAGLAGLGPSVGFRSPETAQDFTKDYNVNSIVVRVPRRLLQGGTSATTFDAWTTIAIPNTRTGRFEQMEQFGRPGINEALILSQTNLAAFNRAQPTRVTNGAVGRVITEARGTLKALGNSDARTSALLRALLPDVMRIDTTGPSGFANALNALGAPIRGRMLKDDVIDAELSILSNGAVTTDNVSYEGTPGNPGQGHQQPLSSFPYLATPN
ncbi:MAG: DUF4331 domain-containing protein [Drouetiella hepatica Uher 2000/2452]|uniref:DUF4331 domain-containing protein n=1 Tax=Drouetiella hepatica Uher 2000/2452 TaxID=904376 RepID=A0A951Q6W5_9CYAN|nr:DUF4331 domain-containing protein [Drouetiella hepatica Uher 2000/2452]